MGWANDTVLANFNSVDGIKKDDVYAVCDDGEIYHFDGENYTQTHISESDLLLVYVGGSGTVYVSNNDSASLIICGNNANGFNVAFSSDKHGLARSFCEYDGRTYVSFVVHGQPALPLYTLENNKLIPVPEVVDFYANENMGTIFRIQSKEGVLWAACDKGVIWFDGQTWQKSTHPLARTMIS